MFCDGRACDAHVLWSVSCVARVCHAAALDTFCEHLEASEILPYVPQLVEQLMAVLQTGRPGVQEMALSAVSSIAAAAQGAFQPYTGTFSANCSCLFCV
jgi:hypothetical protein